MSNASSNTNSGYRASITGVGTANSYRPAAVYRPAAAPRPAGRPAAPRPSAPRPSSPASSRPKAATGSRALRGNSIGTLRGRRMRPQAGRKRKKMVVAKPSHVLMHVPVEHASALVSLGGVPFGVGR